MQDTDSSISQKKHKSKTSCNLSQGFQRLRKNIQWIRQQQKDTPTPEPHRMPSGEESTCLHCGTIFSGNFCPNCGQDAATKRTSARGAAARLTKTVFKYDGTFPNTMKQLFYRPGFLIRDYLNGHRVCYTHPIQLILFLVTIRLMLAYFLPISDESLDLSSETMTKLSEGGLFGRIVASVTTILDNEFYIEMSVALFFIFPAKVCFRRTPFGRDMSLSEHFAAWLFVSSQTVFVDLVFDLLLFSFFDRVTVDYVSAFITVPLTFWDYKQLMGISWLRSIMLFSLTVIMALTMMISVAIVVLLAVNISGALPMSGS